MPQTNVLPDWRATYPADAKAQKPSGINGTVSRTASASAWAAGVVTLTVPAVPDPVGSVLPITVAGFTPAGYNGSYQGTVASATSITYPLASNPGVSTVQGTISYPGVIPLNISTTLPATAVPNKPQWTGTQLMIVGSEEYTETMRATVEEGRSRFAAAEEAEAEAEPEAEAEAEVEAEPEGDEEEVVEEEDDGNGGRRTTTRRVTRTTTTKRRR